MNNKLDDRPAPFTWKRIDRVNLADRGSGILYEAQEDPKWRIVSWRHPIPHANGVGSWDHTTYLVYYSGNLVYREETTLINAKRWVEAHKGGVEHGTPA